MGQPNQPVIPPIAGALIGTETAEDDEELQHGPDDARDVEDATPVGRADLRADVERSGGDNDDDA